MGGIIMNEEVKAVDETTEETVVEEVEVEEQKVDPREEKKYSDNEVDKIVKAKKSQWEKETEKAITEAEKLAEMNEQQKAEYERDKLQKELDILKNDKMLNEMAVVARGMLREENIVIDDELLGMIISTDAEKTKGSVTSFIKGFKKAVEEQVNDMVKRPEPRASKSITAKGRSDILGIANQDDRIAAIARNLEQFD